MEAVDLSEACEVGCSESITVIGDVWWCMYVSKWISQYGKRKDDGRWEMGDGRKKDETGWFCDFILTGIALDVASGDHSDQGQGTGVDSFRKARGRCHWDIICLLQCPRRR